MAFLLPFIPAIIGSVVAAGASAIFTSSSGSTQQSQSALPQATRDLAADKAAISDDLSRRQGANVNRITGYAGAEAQTGAKTSLLGR